MRTPITLVAAALLLDATGCSAPPVRPATPIVAATETAAKPLPLQMVDPSVGGGSAESPLLPSLRAELQRARQSLGAGGPDAPYFIEYEVFDTREVRIRAEWGALIDSSDTRRRMLALRRAPVADPFEGPVILQGRAAAVFFHEALAHRVEGHRQKDDDEGQTLAKKLGEKVLPDIIDVYDDPRAHSLFGAALNGHYLFDDEGVPAGRASVVEQKVFKGFLLSRAPARGFLRSNGHGRRDQGYPVVARQGVLVVQPRRTVSVDDLRKMFVGEIRAQGKSYGLRFEDIDGGYTNTTTDAPQAFKVRPTVVWRVYLDGREELVRGVDLEGTPLTVLASMAAAADDYAVFDGYCGAESGSVPVSAISPSLLVSHMETARTSQEHERPPILPPPPRQQPARGGAR